MKKLKNWLSNWWETFKLFLPGRQPLFYDPLADQNLIDEIEVKDPELRDLMVRSSEQVTERSYMARRSLRSTQLALAPEPDSKPSEGPGTAAWRKHNADVSENQEAWRRNCNGSGRE